MKWSPIKWKWLQFYSIKWVHSKVPGIALRPQTNLEGTYCYEKETTRPQNTWHKMAPPVSLENKTLIYKTTFRPIWTYGIELWGCASKSNIAIMQRYQSKILWTIANAPWYVTNQNLHTDLQIPFVRTVTHDRINKHRIALASHPNPLVEPMLHPEHNRRLKRRWTFDLTDWGGVIGCFPRSPTKLPAH